MRSILLALGALPALALAAESFPTCYAPREELDGGLASCDQMGMVACGDVCIDEGDVCCEDFSGGCPSSAYCFAGTEGIYECCPTGEDCGQGVVSSSVLPSSSVMPSSSVVPSSVTSVVSSSAASSSVPASSADECEEEPISSAPPVSSSVPASASASVTSVVSSSAASSSAPASSADECEEEPISSAPPASSSVSSSVPASASASVTSASASASATSTMTYPESSPVTSEAVSYTTSTICSTNIYTVTKCTDMANLKYCPPYSTTVITDIIPISTTVCTVTPTPTTYGFSTSTVYATTVHTVTSCTPNAGYCPSKSTVKVTGVYAISTTVCPITTTEGPDADYPGATAVPAPPAVEAPGVEYPKEEYEQPAPAPYAPAPAPKEEYEQPAPAPYVPAPAPVEPTEANYPSGPEESAYAPVPGKEYPVTSGAAVAPYPGVAQPTTFYPTAKYTGNVAAESQYPVTAGASKMFNAISQLAVAVVLGAVAIL
ncbi:hypothetical protein QBC37DRAFT_481684 [Rhypophila decipiens]|uniref:Uncharacterized protein n=1 Tax=Rhypophila decipiens TaxID=261697 RepID=A0AAN6YEJ9_9PEZI|nr:hypothetical protein QBC37DRAFT_481684 [Rhypophila decipiens]